MTTGEIIRTLRISKGLSQEDLGKMVGVQRAAINKYEKGLVVNLKRSMIDKLATALDVSPTVILGFADMDGFPLADNIVPLPEMKEWPLLGATACGEPLHRELSDPTVLAPADIKADFTFKCAGDSMIDAHIFDGDIVFVREQPDVENGQIAVVRIEDEYTLKRVYKGIDYVELRPENPLFRPIILRGAELEDFQIVGLAVTMLSRII